MHLFRKAFQGDSCRVLLGALFAGAGAGADGVAVEQDLHPEPLVVVRTLLAHQPVAENLVLFLLDLLLQGGLVAVPTETVYGLGGDGTNPMSAQKIYGTLF